MQRDLDIMQGRAILRIADAHHLARAAVDRDLLERLIDAAEGHPTEQEVTAMWEQERAVRTVPQSGSDSVMTFDEYWTNRHLPIDGHYLPLYDAAKSAWKVALEQGFQDGFAEAKETDLVERDFADRLGKLERIREAADRLAGFLTLEGILDDGDAFDLLLELEAELGTLDALNKKAVTDAHLKAGN